ncbi:MAG: hypothetical protein WBK77_05765, partial [Alphaproteobacteria bacterium]
PDTAALTDLAKIIETGIEEQTYTDGWYKSPCLKKLQKKITAASNNQELTLNLDENEFLALNETIMQLAAYGIYDIEGTSLSAQDFYKLFEISDKIFNIVINEFTATKSQDLHLASIFPRHEEISFGKLGGIFENKANPEPNKKPHPYNNIIFLFQTEQLDYDQSPDIGG